METSLSLLDQLRDQSDADAWNRLVTLYTPLLRARLHQYHVLATNDVDDLVQEVMLTVSQELPKFEHNQLPGAFRNWLRLILVHRLKNFWRSRQRHPGGVGGSDFLEELAQLEDGNSVMTKQWDDEHDQHILNSLLKEAETQFSPHIWQAFHLQVVEKMEPQAVAKRLNMSLSAVYAAKSRVLSVVRKLAEGLVS